MVVFLVGTLLCAWAASCMLERYRCKIKVTDGILSFGGSYGEDNRLYIQVGDEVSYFYQNS